MYARLFKSADFRGRNGVQPDGHIDPEADKAAKKYWAKHKKQEGFIAIYKYNLNHEINGRFAYKEAQKALINISSTSHAKIPVPEMLKAVEGAGYKPTPNGKKTMEDELDYDKGSTHVDLQHENGEAKDTLMFNWAKMPSGKFEVAASLAGGHAESKSNQVKKFMAKDYNYNVPYKTGAPHKSLGPTGTLERETEVLEPSVYTEPIIQERKLPKNPLKAAVFAQPATAVGPVIAPTNSAVTSTASTN